MKITEKIKKFFKSELGLYILVGGSNTVFGWILMIIFANVLNMGYWESSIVCFLIGGMYTYFLNKRYTFKSKGVSHKNTAPKFAANLIICYIISYGPMKILLDIFFAKFSFGLTENLQTSAKLLIANCVFIVINFVGQKFFAFRQKRKKDKM